MTGGFDELAKRRQEGKNKGTAKPTRKPKSSNKLNKTDEKKVELNKEELEKEFEKTAIPMTPNEKYIFSITAEKGAGKTAFAYNDNVFPGNVVVLSFDRKSQRPKKLYGNPERITVFNAIEFLSYNVDNYIDDCNKTFRYVMWLLEKKMSELNPDWIVFDETEKMTEIAEMVMRGRHDLQPFQGIQNRNAWKERKLLLQELHTAALSIAKKGIIYTMYLNQKEIVEESTLITKKDIPKWTGIIMTETDIVVKVFSKSTKNGKRFYAEVLTSKDNDIMRDGDIIDITIKSLKKSKSKEKKEEIKND